MFKRGFAGLGLRILSAAPAACVFVAAFAQAADTPRFVAEDAGFEHVYDGGWEHFVGGGVAVFDCNGDGLEDIYLAGGVNPSALHKNVSRTGGPLRFVRVDDRRASFTGVTGAYPLDIDDDGILDLAVLRVGKNILLRGSGGCAFEPANAAWGYDGGDAWTTAFTARWGRSRSWPTLVFANYVERQAADDAPNRCGLNFLWRPREAGGYGVPYPLEPGHCALSALFSDWNRDGVADLRLSNDRHYYRGGEEQLWETPEQGVPRLLGRNDGWMGLSIWGMGIASRDLNGDSYPDYFLSSMGDNKLRMSSGAAQPSFSDDAYARGLTAHRPFTGGDIRPSTAWHPSFADVNNDGRIDMFLTKGNVEAMKDAAEKDPNVLFLGEPGGGFTEATEVSGLLSFDKGRGAGVADFNLDGMLDIIVVNRAAPVKIWRNTGADNSGNWLLMRLDHGASNRNAVGAWVEVEAGGVIVDAREITVGGGHAGGHLGWIHVGLGAARRAAVRVHWPSGGMDVWADIKANQAVTLTRNQPTVTKWPLR